MKSFEFEVVLNVTYGGFSLDDEMALWLMENRGWTVGKDETFDLIESFGGNYYPGKTWEDEIAFRSDRDLIDCVRAIHQAHECDSYSERRDAPAFNLQVVTYTLDLEVEDYNDGHERLVGHLREQR